LSNSTPSVASPPSAADYSLGQLAAYMLRLGTIGFGGPVALVGYMCITGAVIVLGQRSITDWVTAVLAVGTAPADDEVKKLNGAKSTPESDAFRVAKWMNGW
jgi:hypothetical protein